MPGGLIAIKINEKKKQIILDKNENLSMLKKIMVNLWKLEKFFI